MNKGTADLRQAIDRLDALPAMPVIAQKLLELKPDTDEGQRMLLVLIEQDPQISAKVVGMANSAAVGAMRHIGTVKEAAMLLGMNRVRSIAIGIAIMSLINKIETPRFDMQGLWLHSMGIAFSMLSVARAMPKDARPQDDAAFLAGMLHDIGFLALAFLDPARSDELHERLSAEPNRKVREVEGEMMEICHDELGAILARHWNLPEELIGILRHHHEPDKAPAESQRLARMIHLAEKLLPSFCFNEFAGAGIDDDEWLALGIAPEDAENVKDQVDGQAEQALQFAISAT
jgi:putative nucleotidyltransferase with HDIG domain